MRSTVLGMTGSAAIIGGGIGGLATANALVQQGWSVDVFERSDWLPDTGTALGMWPQAMAALDSIGVGDEIRAAGRRQIGGAFLRADGTQVARVELAEPVHLVTRPALLLALIEALGDGVVKFGAAVASPAELPGYDVVIGADGVNSSVRTFVAGRRVEPEFLGRGALIGAAVGGTDIAVETWGHGKLFGISPRAGAVTNWYAAYPEPVDVAPPADPLAFLREQYVGWHPAVGAVLQRVDEASIVHYRIKQMPKLRSYFKDNVVLIGDAAHAMAPNLGRGACETLIDSVTLATALAQHGVRDGLHRYDAARRRRTQALVTASRLFGAFATSTRFQRTRDAVARAATAFA